MDIEYKGTRNSDIKSRRYRCLGLIEKEYGTLSKFLEDIELKIKFA